MATEEVKGEVKEVLGAVTGDRRFEAEGVVAQKVADPQSPVRDVTENAVDQAESDAKVAHHDVIGEGTP